MSRIGSWIVLLVGVVAAAGAAWWVFGRAKEPAKPPPKMPFVLPVTLAGVQRGDLEPRTSVTGTVRAVQRARLGFPIGGSLASVAVREGDIVKADAPLAQLDDRTEVARLVTAKADTLLARQELAALEAPTRPEEIDRLTGLVRSAEADLAWTGSELERMRPLLADKVVAPNVYAEMQAKKDAAEGRLAAARAALEAARAGSREEDRAVARARVAAREAMEAAAQNDVDRTRLLAPFAGQVLRRLAAPGDAVNAGQEVLELIELGRRELEVEIAGRHAARMGAKPRLVLTLDDRPDFRLEAAFDVVLQSADERTGSVRGLVRLGEGVDDEGALQPGVFVRGTLYLQRLEGVLLVPTDAVRFVEQGPIVVKAVALPQPPPGSGPPGAAPPPHGKPGASAAPPMLPPRGAEMVPVRVLGAADGRTAIEPLQGKLEAGDEVVEVGVDRVFPGATLLPQPPTTPPQGAPPGAAGAKPAPPAEKAP